MSMLSSELEFCLNDAFGRARDDRHEFITVEHLLLALLSAPKVAEILGSCGAKLDKLAKDLEEFIDENTPRLPEDVDSGVEREVQPTLDFSECFSARYSMFSPAAKKKSQALTCWWLFSVKSSPRPVTC